MGFTPGQERSIEEKIELFRPILDRALSAPERIQVAEGVGECITRKRLNWLQQHRQELSYLDYADVQATMKGFYALFNDYMRISDGEQPGEGSVQMLPILDDEHGIFYLDIRSQNFCPYLEAFKRMGIHPSDSVQLCRLALERPCQAFLEQINPGIRFTRDYGNIRPLAESCHEKIVMQDEQFALKVIDDIYGLVHAAGSEDQS